MTWIFIFGLFVRIKLKLKLKSQQISNFHLTFAYKHFQTIHLNHWFGIEGFTFFNFTSYYIYFPMIMAVNCRDRYFTMMCDKIIIKKSQKLHEQPHTRTTSILNLSVDKTRNTYLYDNVSIIRSSEHLFQKCEKVH